MVLDLDTSLTVVSNDVSLDVRLAVSSIDQDSVHGALLDLVTPDKWSGKGLVVVSNDFQAIGMRLGDLIVKQFRLVVLHLNASLANLNLILYDIGVNIKRGDDCRAAAEPHLVALNLRNGGHALNENTRSLTAHNDVLRNDNVILRFTVHHDST